LIDLFSLRQHGAGGRGLNPFMGRLLGVSIFFIENNILDIFVKLAVLVGPIYSENDNDERHKTGRCPKIGDNTLRQFHLDSFMVSNALLRRLRIIGRSRQGFETHQEIHNFILLLGGKLGKRRSELPAMSRSRNQGSWIVHVTVKPIRRPPCSFPVHIGTVIISFTIDDMAIPTSILLKNLVPGIRFFRKKVNIIGCPKSNNLELGKNIKHKSGQHHQTGQ